VVEQMKKILHVLFVFSLASCSVAPAIPSPTLPHKTVTPIILMASPTVPKPTATLEMTSTPAFEPISAPATLYKGVDVVSKCVDLSQDIQDSNVGNGIAVLESTTEVPLGLYFLNMETGILTNLSKQNGRHLSNESVSPDRTLLSIDSGSEILIMRADGTIKKELSSADERWRSAVWQDNQYLIMYRSRPYYEPVAHEEYSILVPGTMLYLNAFTGQQRILVLDFPDLYTPASSAWAWEMPWHRNPVIYSPSLTRAVYLSWPGIYFKLWDTQKKKTLLTWTEFANTEQRIPRWSPDGTKFIMYGALSRLPAIPTKGPFYKLYIVDNDGNFSELVSGSVNLNVDDYFWSPSGRYVALLVFGGDNPSSGERKDRLLVWDSQTKQITDYCVEFNFSHYSEPPLVWSPDETQILLNDKYSETPRLWRLILVDLAKRTAFPIAENMVATGWMKLP
jgi:hypothetical protein